MPVATTGSGGIRDKAARAGRSTFFLGITVISQRARKAQSALRKENQSKGGEQAKRFAVTPPGSGGPKAETPPDRSVTLANTYTAHLIRSHSQFLPHEPPLKPFSILPAYFFRDHRLRCEDILRRNETTRELSCAVDKPLVLGGWPVQNICRRATWASGSAACPRRPPPRLRPCLTAQRT